MKGDISQVTGMLLLLLFGSASVYLIYLYLNEEIDTALVKTTQEEKYLEARLDFPPQITSIRGVLQDPFSALVTMEYYGFEPVPLEKLVFQLVLPNGTSYFEFPEAVANPEECLTPDFAGIKPGAYCIFLLNLSKTLSNTPYNFQNSSIGVIPIVGLNDTTGTNVAGMGSSSSPENVQSLQEVATTVYYLKTPEEKSGKSEVESVKLFSGGEANFVILPNGSVLGWGANNAGQLGLGYGAIFLYPKRVQESFLNNGFKIYGQFKIDAWGCHVCALLSNGTVYCWGHNGHGQLGVGDTTNRYSPVALLFFETFPSKPKQIALGSAHTCALLSNGSLYCWGNNGYGQLGLGYTSYREIVPKAVETLEGLNIAKIFAGGYHTCALLSNGTVYCWGRNDYGQLGVGDTTNRNTPTAVTVLDGLNVTQIAVGGYHTCALLDNGSIYCWGRNNYGQLGLGYASYFETAPKVVKGLDGVNVTKVVAGWYHTCALVDTGSVYCWGWNNYGQLGLGEPGSRYTPTLVTALEGKWIVDIDSKAYDVLALSANKSVYGWGYNRFGELGIGNREIQRSPVEIETLNGTEIIGIASGDCQSCVVFSNGSIFCWGTNAYGGVGIGDSIRVKIPEIIPRLSEIAVSEFALGNYYTCALLSNGSVYCWGHNGHGQLGVGDTEDRYLPAAVEALEGLNVTKIFAGGQHTCALLSNGSVYCWGANEEGQLGLGDVNPRYTPAAVEALEGLNVTKIVGGVFHTCALLSNGTVYCWGRNTYGELGLGDTDDRYLPAAVEALEEKNVKGISAGVAHTCALLANGSVYCWGYNGHGQLGVGDTTSRYLPAAVEALDGFNATQLTSGWYHTCALLSNGTVYCWGANYYGQLGLGDTVNRNLPAAVKALEGKNVTKIVTGIHHTCALLANGSVYCWGYNSYGQLGLGDTTVRYLPTPVEALEAFLSD